MRLLRFEHGRITIDNLSIVELLEALELLSAFDDRAIVMVVSGKDSGRGAAIDDSSESIDAGNPRPEPDEWGVDELFDVAERALGLRMR